MRWRMYAFICRATGESDSSSVVWHVRADELGLELALRRMLLAGERGRREGEGEHGRCGREPHVSDPQLVFACLSALRMPWFEVGVRRRPDDVRRHDAAVRR